MNNSDARSFARFYLEYYENVTAMCTFPSYLTCSSRTTPKGINSEQESHMTTDASHRESSPEEDQNNASRLDHWAKRYDDLGLNVLAQSYRNRADEERNRRE